MKTIFETEDGLQFDTEEEAVEHEKKLKQIEVNRKRDVILSNSKMLNRSDIIEFFKTTTCSECPFCVECKSLQDTIRCFSSKDTFNLCDVINCL